MLKRRLLLPELPKRSFFIWGPRQTGKTSLLKYTYPDALYLDLLRSELRMRYLTAPYLLREELKQLQPTTLVIIDEIQLVPELLNEVHFLIENRKVTFALCGSSARKVKRGAANLLGGRALRYELYGLVSAELEDEFDLLRMLNYGYLPAIYLDEDPKPLLESYVSDYLQEEIAAEGLIRNLPAFSNFLSAAAIGDTEFVNYSNIASDCGISAPTVKEYYQILTDTMLGSFLYAFTPRAKRKVKHAPKFYLADVGIVNALARRGELVPGTELLGKAFENWVFHELTAYISYNRAPASLAYYRLGKEREIDFVINDLEIAIEAKASKQIQARHIKNLRALKADYPKIKRTIIVSLDMFSRVTKDNIEILSPEEFSKQLWNGSIIS